MRNRNLILLIFFAALSGSLFTHAMQLQDEKKRTVFPHAIHMEYDMECIDCHKGAIEEDRATLPEAEVCFECHDEEPDPEWDPPELIAFLKERSRGEGILDFSDSLVFADLKFSHKSHMERGTECNDCHGPVAENKPIQGGNPDFKHACRDCHEFMKASNECSNCHDTYKADEPPADHGSPFWMKRHGLGVSKHFRKLPEDKCFFCHEAQQCDQCHKENKPAWHSTPFFSQRHGEKVRFSSMSMAEAGCAFCHEKNGCQACHQKNQPRSHTVTFKNRTHGMMARFSRDTCQTCHVQSFCINCHTTKEPRSHRGQFGRGQQYHCLSCHLPLSSNACYVCHRDFGTHFTVPRPVDAVHSGATPDTCRPCHAPIPHSDPGLDCTSCH